MMPCSANWWRFWGAHDSARLLTRAFLRSKFWTRVGRRALALFRQYRMCHPCLLFCDLSSKMSVLLLNLYFLLIMLSTFEVCDEQKI